MTIIMARGSDPERCGAKQEGGVQHAANMALQERHRVPEDETQPLLAFLIGQHELIGSAVALQGDGEFFQGFLQFVFALRIEKGFHPPRVPLEQISAETVLY